ncbi:MULTISPECIES: hypothetical protein [unclassified Streptomyces]|uniref:hypothetical protein n=1 Tax=unclassified Streptomyces TaxID=2593676 RepID=UPI003D926824
MHRSHLLPQDVPHAEMIAAAAALVLAPAKGETVLLLDVAHAISAEVRRSGGDSSAYHLGTVKRVLEEAGIRTRRAPDYIAGAVYLDGVRLLTV